MAEDWSRYLGRIESQHRLKPNFMATVEMLLKAVDSANEVASEMPLLFYVKEAKGDQLDIIAKYVGRSRKFPLVPIPGYSEEMSDDTFRIAVLAKIMQNQWDGTNEGFINIWNDTIGDVLEIKYKDNQDMTINVNLEGTIEPLLTEMILGGYVVPKPAGVGMNVEITETAEAGLYWGADYEFNSGEIWLKNHNSDSEGSDSFYVGSAFPHQHGEIAFPNYPGKDEDRNASDSFYVGEAFPSQHASISFPSVSGSPESSDTFYQAAQVYASDARYSMNIKDF